MAAPRFLCKTDLAGLTRVAWAGRPVLAEHERLRAAIAERAPGAAGLLAEPVPSATAISWYAEGAGEAEVLTALSPARRAEAERRLAAAVAALQPLANDADLGPLVRRALVLPEADRIMLLDDRPVLTGWALAPAERAESAAGLAEQVRAVLGRHVPAFSGIDSTFFAAPGQPAAAAPTAAAAPAVSGAAVGATAPGAQAAAPSPPVPPAGPPVGSPVGPPVGPPGGPPLTPAAAEPGRSWWMLPAALGIALVFLLLGFFLAWRIVQMQAGQTLTADLLDEQQMRAQLEMQRNTNAALQAEVERARQALQGDVCRPEAPLAPGQLPPSMTPVPPNALPPAAPATPPGGAPPGAAPDRQGAAPPAGPATVPPPAAPFRGSLAQLLDQGTVLVLAAGEQEFGHGSGFFIAPDLVLTNAHVARRERRLFVVNRGFSRPIEAELVASTERPGVPLRPSMADFALLRVAGAPPVQPLGLTTTADKLEDVVAAGFPGQIVELDRNMREMLQGRSGAVPDLVLTTGVISAIQTLPNGLAVMPHTASVSPGNSGGPLVDRCGRVVGINTFVLRADGAADRANYAQKSDEALAFLQQAGVGGIAPLTGACVPQVPPQAPPPAPPGTPPPAPGATPPPGGSAPAPPALPTAPR